MAVKYKTNKKNDSGSWKSVFVYSTLTLLLVFGLLTFGVRAITSVASFLGQFNSSPQNTANDNTPPPPPRFDTLPKFTNQKTISITGSAEADASVRLRTKSEERDILVSATGSFATTIELEEGENSISALAIDRSGNQSLNRSETTVFLDTVEPAVEIMAPEDGSNLKGKKQKEIAVKGKTEKNTTVSINGRRAILAPEGEFETTISLSDGQNQIVVTAIDQAGNATEVKRIINYSS